MIKTELQNFRSHVGCTGQTGCTHLEAILEEDAQRRQEDGQDHVHERVSTPWTDRHLVKCFAKWRPLLEWITTTRTEYRPMLQSCGERDFKCWQDRRWRRSEYTKVLIRPLKSGLQLMTCCQVAFCAGALHELERTDGTPTECHVAQKSSVPLIIK